MIKINVQPNGKKTTFLNQFIAVFISSSLIILPLQAQPTGAQVVSGSASIQQNATTMQITTSNKAIINYNSFNIGANEILNFVQPSVNSVVLNRVVMANPSSILGTLNANGNVFLVNPAGIYFGSSSSVNANSFVATTLNISDNDFTNGNYAFTKVLDSQSRAIIQQGTINISDNGFVVLAAPMVSSEGRIIAKAGHVVLGATDNFYIQLDAQGLVRYDYGVVQDTAQPIVITQAYANNIVENVLNTDALSSAVKVVIDGDRVILSGASGSIVNSGEIDTGATTNLDAGKIELKAAKDIFVLDKSTLKTNADKIGNGGVIDIYAQDSTYSDKGAGYEAKGGSTSGDGGFIEISAKESVVFNGSSINMETVDGQNGKFLIDPVNLTISADSYTTGADVLYQADEKIVIADGVTISTRQIAGVNSALTHQNDASVGNSGSLTLEASSIEVGSGSKLLTFGDGIYNSGDITLTALSTSNALATAAISSIVLKDALLKGGIITLSSTASFDKSFDTTTVASTDTLSGKALSIFVGSPVSPVGYSEAITDASINIGSQAVIEGSSISITSNANSKSSVMTIFGGAGVGYSKASASAQTTLATGVVLKSTGSVDIKSNAIADNSVKVYTASLGKGRGSKINLTLAIAETDTVSKVVLASGSSIEATGAVSIDAYTSKKIDSTASAGSYADGTLGAAVAVSTSTSTTLADASGTIKSGALNVKAVTDNELIKTTSSAAAGSGFASKIVLQGLNSLIDSASSFFSSKSPSSNAQSGSSSPALSAAFSYSEHAATTTAKLGGDVTATGSVNIQSENRYPIDPVNGAKGIKTSSIATIDTDDTNVKTYALAGAAAITTLDNKAYAYIADDAKVKSDGDIDITAKTYMPYEITWADINSVWDVTSKLNSNLGLQDGFFTTWAQSNSAGKVVGVAGAVNYFKMKNDTQAYIGQRANVNQNTPNAGRVRLIAQTDLQSLNLSGVFGIKLIGSGGGSGGVGGSYLDVSYENITKAEIRDSAKVDASALSLIAETKTKNISIAEAGANSGKYGVAGTFSYLKTNNLTYATTNNAIINTKNAVDDRYKGDSANSNFRLMALDESSLFNVSGGITKAGNVGIGASVSLNEIYRDTQAKVTTTTFNGDGNTFVSAQNLGVIDAFSLAGTITTDSKLGIPNVEKGDANKGGKYGIGVSGDVSINTINDSAKTTVIDSSILNNNKDFIVLSENNSKIRSYSGSVTLSTKGKSSVGFAGSYSQSTIHNTTENLIQNSTVNANNLEIKALNTGSIDTFSASGSLATGGVQVAGSVSNNDITNSTLSKVTTNSELSAQNNLKIASEDTSSIKAIAGAVGFGGKAGIGASVAVNNINNTLQASSDNSELQAQKRIDITAKSTSVIDLIVASLGVGTSGMAGSVAIGINTITSSIKSWVSGVYKNGVDAKTDVVISAIDSSTIDSKAGQLALASKVALGASVVKNTITNTINAKIENSDVSTDGNIYVHAKSTKNIKNQSVAGAVSGAVAINGSVLINNMTDTTSAYITNSKVHTKGSISLEASEVNAIEMFSASLSASKYAGVGAIVALNKIENNIDTYIDGGSDIYAGGNSAVSAQTSSETASTQSLAGLDLIAYSNEKITSTLASGAGGVGALTGVVSVNLLNDNLNSYIDSSNINSVNTNANSAQNVRVRALAVNDTAVMAGAVGVGGVSVGGTSDTTLVTNRTNAYVKDSLIYVKKSFDVNNQGFNRINNIIVAGSGGGTAAIAGSVEVLNIDTQNDAYVSASQIFSDGDVNIISADTANLGIKKDGTRQSVVTGAVAIGGVVGVGGSVSVITVTQDVKAHADSSKLNAKKSTNIFSNTKADIYSVAASGAISTTYLGAAGSVTVNSIDSSSQAYTSGTGMLVNQDASYQTALQDVNVKADSDIDIESKVGAAGVSAGAGIGASIDVATVKNTVLAKLGNSSQTYGQRNVVVQATSDKKVTSNVLAVAGGLAGLSGAVSVVNINSAINAQSADASDSTQSTTNTMLATSRVGTQLDDATLTADVDTATQSQNVSDEFNQNTVIANSVHAVVGSSATLQSGQNTAITATDNAQVTILEGAVAGGVVGIGGSVGIATIGSDARAYIGSGATLNAGSLDIASNFNSKNNKVQTYTGANGFVGLGASVSKLAINYETDAYIETGAISTVSGAANIKAKSDTSALVEAKGAAVGTYAANAVVSDVSIKGNTQASLGVNTQTNAGSLNVNSQYFGDINSLTQGASGGIVAGGGSSSTVNSQPTVIAEVKDGATVVVTGATDIKANASEKIISRADGINGGVLAVGVSISDVTSKPILRASIGSGATITSDSFTLRAYLNKDDLGNVLSNSISSKAFSASGALVGGAGASAIARNNSDVTTKIGTTSSITTTKDLDIKALSDTNVMADSDGRAYGGLSVGYTRADITNATQVTIDIGNDVALTSTKDININAYSKNKASGDVYGGAGGLLSGAGTSSKITMNNDISVALGQRSDLKAQDGAINVSATGHNDALLSTNIVTAGAITANVSEAEIISTQNINILVNSQSKLTAKNINLVALSEKLHAVADARSTTIAASSYSTANSKVNVNANLKITIKDSAVLKGDNKINIVSSYADVYVKSKAIGKIDAGVTGSVFANARNDMTLNSDILVEKNAKLYTNDLYIEAHTPLSQSDKIYIQEATAVAQTVFNYVLTAVDEIVKVFSWIPFVGSIVKKIVKTVMKLIRTVFNSDVSATMPGDSSYRGQLTMNGDIYQIPSSSQSLTIAADGTIVTKGSITATVNANEVIVNDLINQDVGKIVLKGTDSVSGNGNILLSNAYPDVSIQNSSNKKLSINNIDTISNNANSANIDIYTASDTTQFQISSIQVDHTLSIKNLSSSDIVFNGIINNYGGTTTIYNQGGNIFANAGSLIKNKNINISADRGSIGQVTKRLNMQFDMSGGTNPSIVSNSFGSTYIGLSMRESSINTPSATYSIGTLDIKDITSNQKIDIALNSAKTDVVTYNSTTGNFDSVVSDVKSTYNIQKIKSKDDITINGAKGVSIDVSGTIDSGEKDLLVAVDATDPSQSSSEYLKSITANTVVIDDIAQRGGNVNISLVDGSLAGAGSVTVLDGYMHVKVKNDTDKNLEVNSINTNDKVNGGFYLNGNKVTNIAVNNIGYVAGDISIENLGTGTTTLLNDISNQTGSISIKSKNGLINPNDKLLMAKDISLDISSGNIGSSANFIRVDGTVLAKSNGDVHLNGVNNLVISDLIANASTAYLKTSGAISATNVKAQNVELVAVNNIDATLEVSKMAVNSQTGSITLNSKIASNIGTVGSTTGISAPLDIVLISNDSIAQESGADIISVNENVKITTAQNMLIDYVQASKDITLISTNGYINENSDAAVDIKANRFIAKASRGIGSIHTVDTDVNIMDVKNNINGDITISEKGTLELKDIDGDSYAAYNSGGSVKITSQGSMVVQNSVTASSNTELVTGGAFTQATASSITAANNLKVDAKDNIIISNMRSDNNIYLSTSNGDILGNTAIEHNIAAKNQLSLIASTGVVGAVGNSIGIVQGTAGVNIQANGSKNLISVYVKGVDFPANPHENLDLAVLDNRPVSGSRITDFVRILHNGAVAPKVIVNTENFQTNSKNTQSEKEYVD